MTFGIIRLGGVGMLLTQFHDKSAKCKNVRIENEIANEVVCDIKNMTKAGVISIVYIEQFEQISHDLQSQLIGDGYIVKVWQFSGQVCLEELYENSEGIVLLGCDLAEYFWGEKCIVVSENLDMFCILQKEFHSVIASFGHIKQASFNLLASCYGKLMTKLLACFDFAISGFCSIKNNNQPIVEEIESRIKELFSKIYTYYRDEIFVRDLLTCILDVGLLESMLDDKDLLCGYEMSCNVCQSIAKSRMLAGEYAMLVGWFGFCLSYSLANNIKNDLFLPCDIMDDLDYVAEKSGLSKLELLKSVSEISATEYTRYGFILEEYSVEIKKYLQDIFPICKNAMKNFRRIYIDVGAEISSSISLKELSQGVLKSAIFNPKYSFIKTMRVLGVA